MPWKKRHLNKAEVLLYEIEQSDALWLFSSMTAVAVTSRTVEQDGSCKSVDKISS